MSGEGTNASMYTLFQAVSIVMGVAVLFYSMEKMANADFSKLLFNFLKEVSKKVVSSLFKGLTGAL